MAVVVIKIFKPKKMTGWFYLALPMGILSQFGGKQILIFNENCIALV